MLRFDHLCTGNWEAMVNLAARVPVKQHRTNEVMETTASSSRDGAKEQWGHRKVSVHSNRLVTEKPDFEIIDEDYLL